VENNYEQIILQLPLLLLEKKDRGYNFKCPLCGDGKKAGSHRGWLYSNKNFMFHCHNCNKKMSFSNFIEAAFPSYFTHIANSVEDKIKTFKELKTTNNIDNLENALEFKIEFWEDFSEAFFIPLRKHEEALEYCRNRKIPEKVIDNLLWCHPARSKTVPFGKMVIFPFWAGKKFYGFQGRSIIGKKFHTKSPENFKIYNILNVDLSKEVYIFESIIDSLFVPNSIAMLGADIPQSIMKDIQKPVFVFDNDETGMQRSIKYSKEGFPVFLWPDELKDIKDFNQMVTTYDFLEEDVVNILEFNIYYNSLASSKLRLKLSEKQIFKESNGLLMFTPEPTCKFKSFLKKD